MPGSLSPAGELAALLSPGSSPSVTAGLLRIRIMPVRFGGINFAGRAGHHRSGRFNVSLMDNPIEIRLRSGSLEAGLSTDTPLPLGSTVVADGRKWTVVSVTRIREDGIGISARGCGTLGLQV